MKQMIKYEHYIDLIRENALIHSLISLRAQISNKKRSVK